MAADDSSIPAEPSQPNSYAGRGWLLAIVVLIGVAYGSSLPHDFVFDDLSTLRGPANLTLAELPGHVLTAPRAIADLSFYLNTRLLGPSPTGYRAINILIHLLNAGLLFAIARHTLTRWLGGRAVHVAGAVAMLWALHPVNTMAVIYITQRHEALMATFFLLTLLCVILASKGQAMRWGILAVVACGLGMMTKQVMVAAPVVVLLYDRCFLAGTLAGALRQRGLIYLGLAASWLLVLRSLWWEGDASAGFGVSMTSPLSYLLSQGQVILHYLWLYVWPWPLQFDYTWRPAYPDGAWLWPSLVVAGGVLGMLVGLIRNRWWGFVLAWWFAILAPTSSFLPIIDLANEYRLYLPGMAIVGLIVGAVAYGMNRIAWPQWVMLAVAASVFCTLTVIRSADYRDAHTLWQDVVTKNPENPRAWHNLAVEQINAGQLDAAQSSIDRALEINPFYSTAHYHRGRLAELRRDLADALIHYQQAFDIDPRPLHERNFQRMQLLVEAESLLDQKQTQSAFDVLETAMEIDPQHATTLRMYGLAALQLGDLSHGVAALERSVERYSRQSDVWNTLGTLYARRGDIAKAANLFATAVEVDPDNEDAKANLNRARAMLAE